MSKPDLLIIEDEPAIRRLLEYQLQQAGYTVRLAENGLLGLAAVKDRQPDLILLDVMMVGLNGFEVCRRLRAESATAHIPIIFLTARQAASDKLFAFKSGADDYLTKPFDLEELKARVAAVLGRVARAQANQQPLPGRTLALFSPKGGVGTTTLAIQLAAGAAAQKRQPVLLIDLALPLGGVAPSLGLPVDLHSAELLARPAAAITPALLAEYAQPHSLGFQVIPAPTALAQLTRVPAPAALERLLEVAENQGYLVVIDAGSALTELSLAALRRAQRVLTVTSGLPAANQRVNAFLEAAPQLGLAPHRLYPVINELAGPASDAGLARPAVTRIPPALGPAANPVWEGEGAAPRLLNAALAGGAL